MKKNLLIVFILLCVPFIVSAKDLNLVNKNWEVYCEDTCNKSIVGETADDLILATSYNSLEKYNKKTGEIVDEYVLGENSFMEKVNDNFLLFEWEQIEENIYLNKFVVIDKNFDVIKEYELTTDLRYFEKMYVQDNQIILQDNYHNKYYIDENLTVVPFETYEDGTYALNMGINIVKFDKNHKEIKKISYKMNATTDEYDLMKYNDYFVVFYNMFDYKYSDNLYMCNYELYLVNSDLETVDTYKDSEFCNAFYMATHYVHPYLHDPYGDYYRIDITDEKISLVMEKPVEKTTIPTYDKDKEEFSEIFDLEMDGWNSYYFEYEKLNDNYLVDISWYSSSDSKWEYRYYDSSKKLIFTFSEDEIRGIEIFDFFDYYGKLGVLAFKDNKLCLIIVDNNKEILYEYGLEIKDDDFDDAYIEQSNNGFIIKDYEERCAPGNIDGHVNMGAFPYTTVDYCEMYNVNFQYYEFPYSIESKTDGNGSVKAIDKSLSGEEITFEVLANEGYVLNHVKVTDSFGNVIIFKDYKFTMPSADVLIEASFDKIEENPETSDFVLIGLISILIISIIGRLLLQKYKFLK